MQSDRIEPTPEMIACFERRTNEHIGLVRKCLALLAPVTGCGDELIERGKLHDASKFSPEERIPYIWLTEYFRCKRTGEPFAYPQGVKAQIGQAIQCHLATNRHHAEAHADPNEMSDVDLIEMVCDWTAIALEYNQDGGSARAWADKTVGTRVAFNPEKRQFIYEMIELLDRQLDANP